MLPVNLNDTTADHIQGLIDSEVAESVTLEYKRQLPTNQTDEKREFLYDVAAMANAFGGDFVFGIVDRKGKDNQSTGIADSLAGMKIANVQAEISRFENLIRDGISPRLAGISMQPVTCPQGDVLVIRVPRSWNKPHMVTFGGVDKFFGRAATGRFPMRVDEIGRTFYEQRELGETIERWRLRRVEMAKNGKGPIGFPDGPAMLFHAIPASAFVRDPLRESWSVPQQEMLGIYVPHAGASGQYNADGYLRFADTGEKTKAYGYTQLFRSGITEYADASIFYPPMANVGSMILGQVLEQEIVKCYQDAIGRFRRQGRADHFYVGLSLIGIAGKSIFSTFMRVATARNAVITQDSFTSPEVFVDANQPEEFPYGKTLLPLIDTMWQVGGLACSPFKPAGVWNPFGEYR
jgi:hypothetical protein